MKKNMTEVFSTNLRNALYMAGKTQAELAKAVGVTEVSVSKWINGANAPRPNKVDEICRALRCSREDLMVDHDRQVVLAPEDVLAEEMRSFWHKLLKEVKVNEDGLPVEILYQ